MQKAVCLFAVFAFVGVGVGFGCPGTSAASDTASDTAQDKAPDKAWGKAFIAHVAVPASANPWLAEMPDGTTLRGDVVPDHAPVGVYIAETPALSFSVTGRANHGGSASGPDGGAVYAHASGAVFGKSSLRSPINALIGVFLSDAKESSPPVPQDLNFAAPGSRDFTQLAPQLGQMFFIGDGKTASGVTQVFRVPADAADLYLGTMDGWGWYNNRGMFDVTVLEAGV